jgi:SPP1 gp7 family putative phage head morphogenesis protein
MLKDEPFLGVINETNRVLAAGMSSGLADNVPPPAMVNALENDVFVFSGFKTHTQLKEASELLLNADGTIKPYAAFKVDVQEINQAYNVQYLEAEYIFATSSAEMAAKWADLEQGSDRYNLQYRTAGDDRVREWHAVLANTTLPDTDPFWSDYYPPNGWRCRCTAVQVRIGKFPESDPEAAARNGEKATTRLDKNGNNADAIFRFNPGKQKVIFPPHHPYRKVQDGVKEIINSLPHG